MERTWGRLHLTEGHDKSITVGDLETRFVLLPTGVRIYLDGRALLNGLEQPGWRDVSLPPEHDVTIIPRTPDLPVVLRSDEPIVLAVDAKVEFEALLPLWVQIGHVNQSERRRKEGMLLDLPTKAVKRSWFGTPESGEVAYAWRFVPRSKRSYQRHLLSVGVTIVNRSTSVLRFERFLLRAVHLGVFSIGQRLITNGVTVAFKGTEQLSQISFENDEDVLRRGARQESGPREQSGSDIIKRSFGWLRDLAV